MASQQQAEALKNSIKLLQSFDKKLLTARPELGNMTFEAATVDYDRIFDITNYLSVLPIELLTDDTCSTIESNINRCKDIFEEIKKFNLESQNPKQTRDSLVSKVTQRADALFTCASPWIPYLAYQKGDVNKNIELLSNNAGKAAALIEDAKNRIDQKSKEIETIIINAREASVAAGAGVFTTDFKEQAQSLEASARMWLKITATLALLTLLSAAGFYLCIDSTQGQLEVIQKVTSKIAFIAILITATVWCGKIYKSIMHQASTYRFKSLGLQTFQAFSAGAASPQTKDAVLLETTRAIFSQHKTGYIEEGNCASDTQVVEIFKAAIPQQPKQP